jgi:hypothetical protein
LLDHDEGNLGSLDRQSHVDHILGIARKSTGLCEVFFADVGMDQLPLAFLGDFGEYSATQPDAADGVTFEQIPINRGWRCSCVDRDQRSRDTSPGG